MDIKNFRDKLFAEAQAAGLTEYELYCKRNNSFDVNIFEGEIDEYKNESTFGVCFRGKVNGKMGYAFSEKIDDTVVAFLVNGAKQNAAVIEDNDEEFIYAGDAQYPQVQCYTPANNDVATDTKIETAMTMERATLAHDNRVENLPFCGVGTGETEVYIFNSNGLDVHTKSNYAYCQAEAQVENDDEQVKVAFDGYYGADFAQINPVAIGKKVAEKAVAKLGASSIAAGKYPIIFEPEPAGEMLSMWVDAFSADSAHKGFSILAGKLGEEIAASIVTIIDDPLMPLQTATTPFDSEGVASRTKTVVENGVFKTFLHNTKTARKDGVAPTGNGFKGGFDLPVNIAATNFYIQPGEKTHAELLTQMGNGLVISTVEGLHSGANETSGDFSISATGFLVEDGKVTRPVDQITISGNFFTMLKDIVAVGSNLEFRVYEAMNNTASPSLYVKMLDVAGEAE